MILNSLYLNTIILRYIARLCLRLNKKIQSSHFLLLILKKYNFTGGNSIYPVKNKKRIVVRFVILEF